MNHSDALSTPDYTGTRMIHINGQHPSINVDALLAEAIIQQDNGEPVAPWSWMDGLTPAELQDATLARKEELVAFDPFAVASLMGELNRRGVPRTWTERTLKPALKASRPQTTAGRLTWRDYAEAAKALGYAFSINDMTEELEVNGQPISDTIEAKIRVLLHEAGLANRQLTSDTFLSIGNENRHHPIRDYFDSLKWNGEDHITCLSSYFSDSHSAITYQNGTNRSVFEAVMRRYLVGAAGKILDPDKVQNIVPILDGAQGRGKSTFIKWLCPLPTLHVEKSLDLHDKDHAILATRAFIWELPEVGALVRKADRESLKGFLTTHYHTVRPPYGRHAIRKPATASFIASVNLNGALLDDPTGHRRFFPVTLTEIDWQYAQKVDVHQLWAQAVYLYRAGEPWSLTPEERMRHAKISEAYEVEDPLEGMILKYFAVDDNTADCFMWTSDIVEHLKENAKPRQNDNTLMRQVGATLQKMGLKKSRPQRGGQRSWGYHGIRKLEISEQYSEG